MNIIKAIFVLRSWNTLTSSLRIATQRGADLRRDVSGDFVLIGSESVTEQVFHYTSLEDSKWKYVSDDSSEITWHEEHNLWKLHNLWPVSASYTCARPSDATLDPASLLDSAMLDPSQCIEWKSGGENLEEHSAVGKRLKFTVVQAQYYEAITKGLTDQDRCEGFINAFQTLYAMETINHCPNVGLNLCRCLPEYRGCASMGRSVTFNDDTAPERCDPEPNTATSDATHTDTDGETGETGETGGPLEGEIGETGEGEIGETGDTDTDGITDTDGDGTAVMR